MNIGFFTDTYFPQISGVSTSIKLLRNALIEQGHQVIIFTTTDPAATEEAGIYRLPSVPFIGFSDRRITIAGRDMARKLAMDHELDIVHTHTEFSLGLIAQDVADYLNIPLIHTYHTMYENYTHYILNGHLIRPEHVRLFSKMYCNRVDGIITPSRLTYDTLQEYGIEVPMEIIPTGVEIPPYQPTARGELREELGIDADAFVLLSLSRLSKEKDIHLLIEQFGPIKQAHPQAELVIVGDGPARAELEQLARRSGYRYSIHFIGEVPREAVSRYYQMADLYVNASASESQGLTYLEALVNRLPICARYNDYLQDLIGNSGQFGALFRRSADYADTVGNLIEYRQPITDENALFQRISVEQFVAHVLDFYERMTANYIHRRLTYGKRIDKQIKRWWHQASQMWR